MVLTSKPLAPSTWPAFARLVEKHNGIFGGCWCISFHLLPGENKRGAKSYRAMKRAVVWKGRAHAAMVFDGPDAMGWCQFGPTSELPNIRSKKVYDEGLRGSQTGASPASSSTGSAVEMGSPASRSARP